MNKLNAKPKVVTSTAKEVIQLPKSEPLKRLGNEKKKTRSEGDKSLKEKSKDKYQQHLETKRGPGRPKTVVYEKYDLNQQVIKMMSAEGRKLIRQMTEKFKQMQ